jgi:hypothetical protein
LTQEVPDAFAGVVQSAPEQQPFESMHCPAQFLVPGQQENTQELLTHEYDPRAGLAGQSSTVQHWLAGMHTPLHGLYPVAHDIVQKLPP